MDVIFSVFSSVMPPSIREICEKISEHKATGPEVNQYTAGIRTDPLRPKKNAGSEFADPADRFNALQPILIPDTSQELVVSVLRKKAVFR